MFAGESDQAFVLILGESWFDKPTSFGVPMGVLFFIAMLGLLFANNNANTQAQISNLNANKHERWIKELGEHVSDSNNNVYFKNSVSYEEAKNVLDVIAKHEFNNNDILINKIDNNYVFKTIVPDFKKEELESSTEIEHLQKLIHDLSVLCFDFSKADIHFCDKYFNTKHIYESSENITIVSDNSYIVAQNQLPQALVLALKEFMAKTSINFPIWVKECNNTFVITYYSNNDYDVNESDIIAFAFEFSLEVFNGNNVNLKVYDFNTQGLMFNVKTNEQKSAKNKELDMDITSEITDKEQNMIQDIIEDNYSGLPNSETTKVAGFNYLELGDKWDGTDPSKSKKNN
ncbi:MAG: hypothetical protein H8E55_61205 [Pelagibacterales bacterium]|nr:hypothetical protein [Pelagibacterales bacterium]